MLNCYGTILHLYDFISTVQYIVCNLSTVQYSMQSQYSTVKYAISVQYSIQYAISINLKLDTGHRQTHFNMVKIVLYPQTKGVKRGYPKFIYH